MGRQLCHQSHGRVASIEGKRAGATPSTGAELIGLASVKWPLLPGTKEPPINLHDLKTPESHSQIALDLQSRKGYSPTFQGHEFYFYGVRRFNKYCFQLLSLACRFLSEIHTHILTGQNISKNYHFADVSLFHSVFAKLTIPCGSE